MKLPSQLNAKSWFAASFMRTSLIYVFRSLYSAVLRVRPLFSLAQVNLIHFVMLKASHTLQDAPEDTLAVASFHGL